MLESLLQVAVDPTGNDAGGNGDGGDYGADGEWESDSNASSSLLPGTAASDSIDGTTLATGLAMGMGVATKGGSAADKRYRGVRRRLIRAAGAHDGSLHAYESSTMVLLAGPDRRDLLAAPAGHSRISSNASTSSNLSRLSDALPGGAHNSGASTPAAGGAGRSRHSLLPGPGRGGVNAWFPVPLMGGFGRQYPLDFANGLVVLSKLKEGGLAIDWAAAAHTALQLWSQAPESVGRCDAWPMSTARLITAPPSHAPTPPPATVAATAATAATAAIASLSAGPLSGPVEPSSVSSRLEQHLAIVQQARLPTLASPAVGAVILPPSAGGSIPSSSSSLQPLSTCLNTNLPASVTALLVGSQFAELSCLPDTDAPPNVNLHPTNLSSASASASAAGRGRSISTPFVPPTLPGLSHEAGGGSFSSPGRSETEQVVRHLASRLCYDDMLPSATHASIASTLLLSEEVLAQSFSLAIRAHLMVTAAASTGTGTGTGEAVDSSSGANTGISSSLAMRRAVEATLATVSRQSMESGQGFVILDARDVPPSQHAAWAHACVERLQEAMVHHVLGAVRIAVASIDDSALDGHGNGTGMLISTLIMRHVREALLASLAWRLRIFHLPFSYMVNLDTVPEVPRPPGPPSLSMLPSKMAALANEFFGGGSGDRSEGTASASGAGFSQREVKWLPLVRDASNLSIDRRSCVPALQLASALAAKTTGHPYSPADVERTPGIAALYRRPFIRCISSVIPELTAVIGVQMAVYAGGLSPGRLIVLRDMLLRSHLPYLSVLHS